MRPALLNPLFAQVTSLSGIGPKQDKLFRYLLGRDDTPRLVDLLLHLPTSVIDRRAQPKIRDAVSGGSRSTGTGHRRRAISARPIWSMRATRPAMWS
jgi:RecG-like helicase